MLFKLNIKQLKCDLPTRILEQSDIEDFCRDYGNNLILKFKQIYF